MKKPDLTALTAAELKALAERKKVPIPSGAKKADILAALIAAGKKPAKAAVKKAAAKKAGKAAPGKRPRRAPPAEPAKAPEKPREEWKMPPGVEEPLMAQERVETAKYYTGPAHPVPAAGAYGELPAEYGEDRIALMARDPYVAFAYWEVTPGRLEREKQWFGWDSRLCVRIYDVTGVQFDGGNATGHYDQDISERVGSWYFGINRPSRSFVADIGLRSPDGRFLTLARSNYVVMPRDGASDVIDEEWMITEEEFRKLYGFGEGLSSQEVAELWRQRRLHGISSPGMSAREGGKGKRRV